jgi:hypothetical protein
LQPVRAEKSLVDPPNIAWDDDASFWPSCWIASTIVALFAIFFWLLAGIIEYFHYGKTTDVLSSLPYSIGLLVILPVLLTGLFYPYRVYQKQRHLLLYYAIFSGGGIMLVVLLGALGRLIINLFRFILLSTGLNRIMTFRRTATSLLSAIVICFTMLCFLESHEESASENIVSKTHADASHPAKDSGGKSGFLYDLVNNVPEADEYKEEVENAKEHYGADASSGSQEGKYKYFKRVYVATSIKLKPDFDETLSTLLRYRPGVMGQDSSFKDMVSNAYLFRRELLSDELISDTTYTLLEEMSAEVSSRNRSGPPPMRIPREEMQ